MKLILLTFFFFLNMNSCTTKPDIIPMEIRYTSINDVYANYVFNFENNLAGIKKVNDFADKDIESSKKVSDSINNKIINLTKEEAEKYMATQSLPTSASNIVFYKAPGDFDGEPNTNNIIIEYILDEDSFGIRDINIPNYKSEDSLAIVVGNHNSESCIVKVEKSDITLQDLKQILQKISETGYQENSENYTYKINGEKDNLLLSLHYEQKGKYFRLSFDK